MKSRQVSYGLAAVCVAVLAACGGGGGSSGGSDGGKPIALSGAVIDGYITGATVFLDLNNNQTLDSGEPSTTSTTDGKYTLTLTGVTAAQARAGHIVTIVPTSAKDSDDGGQTLAQAGKSAFTMLAPAQAYVATDGTVSPAVVSPITTLLSHDMLADGTKSLATSTTDVQTRLGLTTGTSLLQDPTLNNDLKTKAQVIAAAIGQVKTTVQTSASGTSDRDALFAALVYLQQNIAALQQAVATLQVTNAALSANAAVINAVTNSGGSTSALVPASTTLLTSAQQTTGSTQTEFASVLAGGFYSLNCLNDCDDGSAGNYSKIVGTSTTWQQVRHSLTSAPATWIGIDSNFTSGNMVLGTSGWVAEFIRGGSGTWVAEGAGAGVSTDSRTGERARQVLRVQSLDGKTFGSIPGFNVPSAFASNVFPNGATAYYFSSERLNERYMLHTNSAPFGEAVDFSSLEAMIDARQTPAADSSDNPSVVGSNGLNFTFNEAASVALPNNVGTLRLYTCSLGTQAAISNGCTGGQWNPGGSATYNILTVNGQTVLRINATYGTNGGKLIYAVAPKQSVGNVVQIGEYQPVNSSVKSTGVNFNKTAIDALLTAAGKPITPQ